MGIMRSTSFKKNLRNKSLRNKSLRKKSFKSNRGGSRTISKRGFRRKSNWGFNRLQKGGGVTLEQVKRLINEKIETSATTTNTGDYIISKVEDIKPYHILSVNVGVRAYYIINNNKKKTFFLENASKGPRQSGNSVENLCLSFRHKSLPIPSEYISPLTGERTTLRNKKDFSTNLKTLGDYSFESVEQSALTAVGKRTPLLKNETRTHILWVYLGFIHYKIQRLSTAHRLIDSFNSKGET